MMISGKPFILTCLLVMFLMAPTGSSRATTIAVLPMEDLSLGGNGVNFSTTGILEKLLASRGYTVTPREEVISFMVRHRVRWLGYLNSRYSQRFYEELQVEYLLIGSLRQQRQTPPYSMYLNIQLICTKDASLAWCANVELNDTGDVSFLGLGEQLDPLAMERQVAEKAILALPPAVQTNQPPPVRQRIESVQLTPQIVKPGTTIQCRVTLTGNREEMEKTSLSFFVDDRIIDGEFSENSFIGSWPSGTGEKRYTVFASITDENGISHEVKIGQYQVDGQPPTVHLNIKGQELQGTVILQKQVQILPHLTSPEPISRWQMSVLDDEGNEMTGGTGEDLPDHFSWWGQTRTGGLVQDGLYSIQLTVWDRAGNQATTQAPVRVVRKKPTMVLAMEKQNKNIAVNLNYEGEIPLAYWRLQISNKNGAVLAEKSGTSHSKDLLLPLGSTPSTDMVYTIFAQDMIGNRIQQTITPDFNKPVQAEKAKTKDKDGNFLATIDERRMAQVEIWTDDF